MSWWRALVLVGSVSMLLAGCAGEGSGAAESADAPERPTEAQVSAVVAAVMGSFTEREACTTYLTEDALAQQAGLAAVDDLEVACDARAATGLPALDVEVTDVEIEGDEATARAVPGDGGAHGLALDLVLVEDADVWKVAGIVVAAVVDRPTIDVALLDGLDSLESHIGPDGVACIEAGVRAVDDEAVVASVMEASVDYLAIPARECLGGGDETAAMAALATAAATLYGFDPSTAACIGEAAAVRMPTITVAEVLMARGDAHALWTQALLDAEAVC